MKPSILWSAPVPPAAKHPHNMMLPPPWFTVGMVIFGLQASPFSSKHNDGHYGQTVLFLFHQTRGHFSKKYDLCPHVQLQTVVDIDNFVPVSSSIFTRSFAVLGLICTFRNQSTLISDRTHLLPERYDGCVVPWCLYLVLLFVQMNVVPSGIWKLLPSINQTCGGLQHFFWGLGWFLLIFPWCQAKRHWVWR